MFRRVIADAPGENIKRKVVPSKRGSITTQGMYFKKKCKVSLAYIPGLDLSLQAVGKNTTGWLLLRL